MKMPEIYIPTRSEIEALKEGDLAPDCFGNWRRVTRIYARGDDVKGQGVRLLLHRVWPWIEHFEFTQGREDKSYRRLNREIHQP